MYISLSPIGLPLTIEDYYCTRYIVEPIKVCSTTATEVLVPNRYVGDYGYCIYSIYK